jgi:hypothetical protein
MLGLNLQNGFASELQSWESRRDVINQKHVTDSSATGGVTAIIKAGHEVRRLDPAFVSSKAHSVAVACSLLVALSCSRSTITLSPAFAAIHRVI